MTLNDYRKIEQKAGGTEQLHQLLSILSTLLGDSLLGSHIDKNASPLDILVPSAQSADSPNLRSGGDGAYLEITPANKLRRLYEVTFGVCYGSTCGQGETFLFKFSKDQWHFREHLCFHLH